MPVIQLHVNIYNAHQIVTRLGRDDPRNRGSITSNSEGCPSLQKKSRPALGHTLPPIQKVPGIFTWGESAEAWS